MIIVCVITHLINIDTSANKQIDTISSTAKNIQKSRKKWPFIKKNYLLTKTEARFYLVLKEILKNDYLIFSKVKIGDDILYLPNYSFRRETNRNRVKSRHVDFLICDIYTRPLLAVELDDYTHNLKSRIKRDDFVDEVFEDAGLPILHIPVSYNYNKEELISKIKGKIS